MSDEEGEQAFECVMRRGKRFRMSGEEREIVFKISDEGGENASEKEKWSWDGKRSRGSDEKRKIVLEIVMRRGKGLRGNVEKREIVFKVSDEERENEEIMIRRKTFSR